MENRRIAWLPVLRLAGGPSSERPTADGPDDRYVEFEVGVRSMPYLADHGFHDMVVLPGSFHVETARFIHSELFQSAAATVRNVEFDNPVILGDEAAAITVQVGGGGNRGISYTFYEASQVVARLEIDGEEFPFRERRDCGFPVEAFKNRAESVTRSAGLYRRLRDNGNQYGPQFQNLSAIWRVGDEALGQLAVPKEMVCADP